MKISEILCCSTNNSRISISDERKYRNASSSRIFITWLFKLESRVRYFKTSYIFGREFESRFYRVRCRKLIMVTRYRRNVKFYMESHCVKMLSRNWTADFMTWRNFMDGVESWVGYRWWGKSLKIKTKTTTTLQLFTLYLWILINKS